MQNRCLGFKRTKKKEKKKAKIYLEFKDQLRRSQEGWYQTKLLWKTNTNKLPPNKTGSLGRLRVLLRNSKKNPLKFNQYNDII